MYYSGVGALIGGVVGGGIAIYQGKDTKGVLKAAATGFVGGAIVGSGAGFVGGASTNYCWCRVVNWSSFRCAAGSRCFVWRGG